MITQFSRTELLFGPDSTNILKNKRVAIFGVGGVGGFVCEALARSGVGAIDIIDNDTVALSNINRQIIALHSTIGMNKVDVMEKRILDINPECIVRKYTTFFLPETSSEFPFEKYDYVVDAIDTVKGKIGIIEKCSELNIKLISSMGAGNKFNPQGFKITDITKTKMDPLARVLRGELRKRKINHLDVCFSEEKPIVPYQSEEKSSKRVIPGSNPFVPASCGLLIASYVIQNLINGEKNEE